jgi:sulfite reductase (NADPH) hemoprotein beta-component
LMGAGRALGRYDLRLGADHRGERLNAVYRENVDETTILSELDTLFARYGAQRESAEAFRDFVRRAGVLEG